MNLLGYILLALVVAAAAQAIISALLVFAVVLVLWGLLFRTRETVGLLVSLLFVNMLTLHPWATIGVSLAFSGAVLIARHFTACPLGGEPRGSHQLPVSDAAGAPGDDP